MKDINKMFNVPLHLPFNVIHDFIFQVRLPLICRYVECHFAFNDALANVLHACAFGWLGCQVDELINLKIMNLYIYLNVVCYLFEIKKECIDELMQKPTWAFAIFA